jgi:hypothetical protein
LRKVIQMGVGVGGESLAGVELLYLTSGA